MPAIGAKKLCAWQQPQDKRSGRAQETNTGSEDTRWTEATSFGKNDQELAQLQEEGKKKAQQKGSDARTDQDQCEKQKGDAGMHMELEAQAHADN
jgi:hypothetical protein